MTEQQERVLRLAVNVTVSLASLGVMLWIVFPELRDRVRLGAGWARYYRWRAWWSSLPAHLQEAAIVRGKGPAE